MSCKYCDEYADIDPTVADERMARCQAYIEHCVSLDGKQWTHLVFTDGCDEWETPIGFCPFCGEDLRKGAER
jgi:hypothetical protein